MKLCAGDVVAYLRFFLSNPRWFFTAGPEGCWKIVYDLKKRGWEDELLLPSGSDLLKLPGSLHLTGGEIKPRDDGAFGALHHLEADEGSSDGVVRPSSECFSVECTIPADQVAALIEGERFGYSATDVSLSIPNGIAYGNMPDGSDKRWDVETNWLPVNLVSFWFARDDDPTTDESESNSEAHKMNVAIHAAILSLTQTISERSKIALGVLIGIGIILAFK